MTGNEFQGCRILVVEDESIIALAIEDALVAQGCLIVGPIGKLETALQAAHDEILDGAILDVSVRGGKIYPVAEQLMARGIPFVLSSGYGDWALPVNLQGQRRLTKPFTTAELEAELKSLCLRCVRGEAPLRVSDCRPD